MTERRYPSGVSWDGPALCIPAGVGSLASFRDWAHSDDFPEHGRICFLDGEIHIDMSPDELENHNKVRGAIDFGITKLNDAEDIGEYFLDGAFVTNKVANLATVPDGTFVKWETSASGQVRFIQRKDRAGEYVEIQGTPDWIFEAVSFSSVKKDKEVLPVLYHRAGIPEFWLVDAGGPAIDFQILLHRRDRYRASKTRSGWSYSPIFEHWFRLIRRHNRQGRWNYTLEFKS